MQTDFSTKQVPFSGQQMHDCNKPGCWFCYYMSIQPTHFIPAHTVIKRSKASLNSNAKFVIDEHGNITSTKQMAYLTGYSLGHVYNILNGFHVNKTSFRYLK